MARLLSAIRTFDFLTQSKDTTISTHSPRDQLSAKTIHLCTYIYSNEPVTKGGNCPACLRIWVWTAPS